jgi:TPR repeat protein
MELKNGIKNFFKKQFKKLLEGFLGLIILIGVIYYLSPTDWWNETTERNERLKIQSDATYRAQVLGSEGVELQSKLSLLIIRRDTITDEPELKTLNEEIKNTIDEIQTKYFQYLRDRAGQIKGWHNSVEDHERINRTQVAMGWTTTTVVLKKEWCYSAYQTAYWKTAYSHCKYHAKLNDAKAQYFLGSILENGSGVSKDTQGAYVWYTIAVLNDYDAAVAARENLLSTLQSREISSGDQRVIHFIKNLQSVETD